LLKSFKKVKGNLNKVYDLVMLSDILVDDERFRQIIDEEIAKGTVESYPAYEKETDETRQKAKDAERKRREAFDKQQAQEQEEEAQPAKGKAKTKAKPKGKKNGTDDMAGLAALIQQRQKARAGNFFDSLEAKYAPKSRGSKRSTPMDEPSEEAFEANRKKQKSNSRSKKKAKEESEDEAMESGEEDIGDSEEEETPPPKQKTRAKRKVNARGRA
jgi:DnaJ family protein C protein 9